MKKVDFKGIAVIALMSVAAWLIAMIPQVKSMSLSSLIVGIIIGMIYANTYRKNQPQDWDSGMKFCSKRILRLGIILYGFRLTFQDVVAVGVPAIVVDCIVVSVTLLLGLTVGRLLKMDRDTTILTSTGSAICGAAAVLGAEPIVKAESSKTAVAVSTVVIFGTISMFLYPIMYRMGWLDDLTAQQTGIYVGSTLHEVAHVVGAGNAIDPVEIASGALIVKMVRVILLVPVLLIMSYVLAKITESEDAASGTTTKRRITIPWFAFLFLLMIAINSLLHSFLPAESFAPDAWAGMMLKAIEFISTFMLTMAMTALGADTSFDKFKQAGAKPFVLAAILFVWLVVGGYLLARFLVPIL